MSMPSSRLLVATTHGSSPRLSASSVSGALLAAHAAVVRAGDLDRGARAGPGLRHHLGGDALDGVGARRTGVR